METKFQTSFIPKKPTASAIGGLSPAPRHRPTASIFMTIAVLIFIASIVSAGGVYAYKQYLLSTKITYQQQLDARKKQFNLDLITKLNSENIKINKARNVLKNHIALSQIFDIIGKVTTENVRFMSLDVTVPSAGSDVKISLQGYGSNLSAVAFQSTVLAQLETLNLRDVVKNPILSNPALGGNGNTVGFNLSAVVDPASLSYEKMVSPASSGTGTTTTQ